MTFSAYRAFWIAVLFRGIFDDSAELNLNGFMTRVSVCVWMYCRLNYTSWCVCVPLHTTTHVCEHTCDVLWYTCNDSKRDGRKLLIITITHDTRMSLRMLDRHRHEVNWINIVNDRIDSFMCWSHRRATNRSQMPVCDWINKLFFVFIFSFFWFEIVWFDLSISDGTKLNE